MEQMIYYGLIIECYGKYDIGKRETNVIKISDNLESVLNYYVVNYIWKYKLEKNENHKYVNHDAIIYRTFSDDEKFMLTYDYKKLPPSYITYINIGGIKNNKRKFKFALNYKYNSNKYTISGIYTWIQKIIELVKKYEKNKIISQMIAYDRSFKKIFIKYNLKKLIKNNKNIRSFLHEYFGLPFYTKIMSNKHNNKLYELLYYKLKDFNILKKN